MEIRVKAGNICDVECDAAIVGISEKTNDSFAALDVKYSGRLSKKLKKFEFKNEYAKTFAIDTGDKDIIIAGLGKSDCLAEYEMIYASGAGVKKAEALKTKTAVAALFGTSESINAYESAKAMAMGAIFGNYKFNKYKTKDNSFDLDTFVITGFGEENLENVKKGVKDGKIIANAVVFARDLANDTSDKVTPEYLADCAEKLAKKHDFDCEIYDRKKIIKNKMGLLEAVSRGATKEPRFIKLVYTSDNAKKTIAIVGKGITFDTGGYSLKNSISMYTMNGDMSGAADVLGVMSAVGEAKPNINIVALIPTTENSIGPDAFHPGDVAYCFDGQSVEINNTDAEGRLILADALAFAKSMKVDEIIDVATLTGACVIALGKEISGILGTNQELIDKLIKHGRKTAENYWQLPYHTEYKKNLKSKIADMKNTSKGKAGTIEAALFLGSFVGDIPWAHLDLSAIDCESNSSSICVQGFTACGTGAIADYILFGSH